MIYNKHLANRFVSDYKLPIPITFDEYLFNYYLDLFEKDYQSRTKWNNLIKLIEENFDKNSENFIDEYKKIREEIITTVLENPYYQEFNNMDMNKFAIKDKINVSSNNIYNQENIVNKIFLSIDLKKANFQALKYVNPKIVYDCETYEDFIGKFTDLNYIKDSKYSRQVIFGMLNPKRHITVEKYMINEIRKVLIPILQEDKFKLISMSNDELIYEILIEQNENEYKDIVKNIEIIINNSLGFKCNIDIFFIAGYDLYSLNTFNKIVTFYERNSLIKSNSILKCVPQPLFPIIYKLYHNLPVTQEDRFIEYERMKTEIKDNLELHITTQQSINEYITQIKKEIEKTIYTKKDIDDNLSYFKTNFIKNISPYKAIELFYYHLNNKKK